MSSPNLYTGLLLPVGEHPTETSFTDWRNLCSICEAECIQSTLLSDGSLLICNENFIADGATPNRRINNVVFAGPLVIVGEDHMGSFCSLPSDRLTFYKKRFWTPPVLNGTYRVSTTSKDNVVTIDQEFIPHNADLIRSQILQIRDTGHYNMLSLREVQRYAFDHDMFDLVCWIEDEPQAYWNFIMTGRGL